MAPFPRLDIWRWPIIFDFPVRWVRRFAACRLVFGGFRRFRRWRGLRGFRWRGFLYYLVAAAPLLLLGIGKAFLFPNMFAGIWLVPLFLIVNGILLILGDGFQKRKETGEMSLWIAILIGAAAQLFAVLPGLSRVTLALFVALFWGLQRREAVKFALLTALPLHLVFLAGGLIDRSRRQGALVFSTEELIAAAAAFVAAFAAAYFLKKVACNKLTGFAVYCFIFALLLILLLLLGM